MAKPDLFNGRAAAPPRRRSQARLLVENLNRWLRSDFFLRRRLGSDYLALLQFYRNDRWLERSDRPRACGESILRVARKAALVCYFLSIAG